MFERRKQSLNKLIYFVFLKAKVSQLIRASNYYFLSQRKTSPGESYREKFHAKVRRYENIFV